jgi:mycofactocin precursor
VSEPQVLEPTELDPDSAPHGEVADRETDSAPHGEVADRETDSAPHGEVADWGTTPEQPADEVLDDHLLVEEISIDGMCGVY